MPNAMHGAAMAEKIRFSPRLAAFRPVHARAGSARDVEAKGLNGVHGMRESASCSPN